MKHAQETKQSRSRLGLSKGLIVSLLLHALVFFPFYAARKLADFRPASTVKLQVELFGMLSNRQAAGQEAVAAALPPPPPPPPVPEPEPAPEAPPAEDQVALQAEEPEAEAPAPPPPPPAPPARPPARAQAQQTIRPSREEINAQRRYMAEIARAVRAKLVYPEAAKAEGLLGAPGVRFRIEADGSVRGASIHKSSGYAVLDEQAVRAVRAASPFPTPPRAMEIVLEIDFRERALSRT